jgi:high-affinity nickel-transport protein
MPATWTALCALAFALGIRHGFDADHLATIDALARLNARRNPRLARFAGALFSLGHGMVVTFVALAVGSVTAVGALFAISFDTLSQAALFALAARSFGAAAHAVAVAGLFMTGMLLVDGINGLWISRLLGRADATAASASRAMALAIAGLALAIGTAALGKLAFPEVAGWLAGRELTLGFAVIFCVLATFLFGIARARRA